MVEKSSEHSQLPISFSDESRVWIYQSSRAFSEQELTEINQLLRDFTHQWVSHQRQLKAHGEVLHRLFIVLMVEDNRGGASGCSIDSSVRFIQSIEKKYNVRLFDRMTFAYFEGATVQLIAKSEMKEAFRNNLIHNDTLFFDNLVATKGDLRQKWLVPLRLSWHKRFV